MQQPGSGYRPPAWGPFLLGHTPNSSHVRFHLPTSSQREFTTSTHSRVQVSRSQPVSDLHHLPPTPSTSAPDTRRQGLSAQDIDLLSFPRGPPTPWGSTPPHPHQGGGVTVHACQPLTHSMHTAASLLPTPCQGYNTSTPAYAYTNGAPPPPHLAFRRGPARHLPHRNHFSFGRGGGGARVALLSFLDPGTYCYPACK